jgi:hypothetical protein
LKWSAGYFQQDPFRRGVVESGIEEFFEPQVVFLFSEVRKCY